MGHCPVAARVEHLLVGCGWPPPTHPLAARGGRRGIDSAGGREPDAPYNRPPPPRASARRGSRDDALSARPIGVRAGIELPRAPASQARPGREGAPSPTGGGPLNNPASHRSNVRRLSWTDGPGRSALRCGGSPLGRVPRRQASERVVLVGGRPRVRGAASWLPPRAACAIVSGSVRSSASSAPRWGFFRRLEITDRGARRRRLSDRGLPRRVGRVVTKRASSGLRQVRDRRE